MSRSNVDYPAFIIHCKLVVQNDSHVAPKDIRFEADYKNPLSVMIKLAETYPDTMIWGSDAPAYYWIQKYYTGNGELIEDRLDCGYKEETQLLHELQKPV